MWTEPNFKDLFSRTEINNFVTFQPSAGHANVSLALISNWQLDGKYISAKCNTQGLFKITSMSTPIKIVQCEVKLPINSIKNNFKIRKFA